MYDGFFWSAVLVGDDCWEWTGYRNPQGYGKFNFLGDQLAHRVAYRMMVGAIPEGMTLDHLCRNRGCVRPSHLEPVTAVENTKRGIPSRADKTHCPKGHPYAGNEYVRPDGRGRMCRSCARARAQSRGKVG